MMWQVSEKWEGAGDRNMRLCFHLGLKWLWLAGAQKGREQQGRMGCMWA